MRVAVMSDIHANLPALEAVLDDIGDGRDALWVTGDIVGYGSEPDAVVERLQREAAVAVRGNHDHVAAGNAGAAWFNPVARSAIEWTADAIAARTRTWLGDLPTQRDEAGWRLVHGSPRDPLWEYVEDTAIAAEVLSEVPVDRTIFGHTHVPIAYLVEDARVVSAPAAHGSELELGDRRAMLNPGSVGQPRDGDPRASYLVLDTEAGRASWRRVAYDVELAARRILAAGLPTFLASRLAVGR